MTKMDVPALIASPVGTVSTVSRAAPVAVAAGLATRPGSQRGERSTLTAAHVGLAVAAACSWSVHKRGKAAVKGPKRVQMRPGCSAKKRNKFKLEFMTKSIVSHFSSSNLIKTCRICRNLLGLWGSDMFCVLDLGRAMLRGTHRCAKTRTPRTPCGDASRP